MYFSIKIKCNQNKEVKKFQVTLGTQLSQEIHCVYFNYYTNEFSSYAEVSSLSGWFYENNISTETGALCHTPTFDDATDFSCNDKSSHSPDI